MFINITNIAWHCENNENWWNDKFFFFFMSFIILNGLCSTVDENSMSSEYYLKLKKNDMK